MKTKNDNTACKCHCHLGDDGVCYKDCPHPKFECQHCTDTSFFAMPKDKQKEILEEAADEANRMQRELVCIDTTENLEDKIRTEIEHTYDSGVFMHPEDKKTAYDNIMAIIHQQRQQVREQTIKYMAFCECGDALERKELYPSEATYYCFGCDKSYKLKQPTDRKGE